MLRHFGGLFERVQLAGIFCLLPLRLSCLRWRCWQHLSTYSQFKCCSQIKILYKNTFKTWKRAELLQQCSTFGQFVLQNHPQFSLWPPHAESESHFTDNLRRTTSKEHLSCFIIWPRRGQLIPYMSSEAVWHSLWEATKNISHFCNLVLEIPALVLK